MRLIPGVERFVTMISWHFFLSINYFWALARKVVQVKFIRRPFADYIFGINFFFNNYLPCLFMYFFNQILERVLLFDQHSIALIWILSSGTEAMTLFELRIAVNLRIILFLYTAKEISINRSILIITSQSLGSNYRQLGIFIFACYRFQAGFKVGQRGF